MSRSKLTGIDFPLCSTCLETVKQEHIRFWFCFGLTTQWLNEGQECWLCTGASDWCNDRATEDGCDKCATGCSGNNVSEWE